MKSKLLPLANREKYAIIVVLSIIAFTYLYDNVVFDIYNHLAFPERYSADNIYKQNWENSLALDIWALSGLPIVLGIIILPKVILGTTTTPMFPGMIFLLHQCCQYLS